MFDQPVPDVTARFKQDTKRSSFFNYRCFVTAFTHRTSSFPDKFTATGDIQRSFATIGNTEKEKSSTMQTSKLWSTVGTQTDDMAKLSQWSETLKQKDTVPDPELENWSSGGGQHAAYQPHERDLIPLSVEHIPGQSTTALVESVHCMR
jgi:hypothetical protein